MQVFNNCLHPDSLITVVLDTVKDAEIWECACGWTDEVGSGLRDAMDNTVMLLLDGSPVGLMTLADANAAVGRSTTPHLLKIVVPR